MELIGIDDVTAAAGRLRGRVLRTPLLECPWAPGGLWLKPESLQPVGAFKIRGATNALARLDERTRAAGVVTHSSGNHGQALAYAARAMGVGCTVVVPEGAPEVKVAAMRRFGARIVMVPPAQRRARAEALAAEHGATLVPPFDHADVIAGQGTIGPEILEDLPDADVVLVPVGGGGLASGVATAVTALRPGAKVIGVQPELAADAAESLAAGRLVSWPPERAQRTVADGVRVSLSELTFAHLRARLDGVVTVTEEEILAAMGVLARRARVVAEPSGAVAAAAHLAGRTPPGRAVAVVSGGNVQPDLLARAITEF
ncbi:threonine dehydratase [Spinactinospora alkalitolerans]|uniref:threonine ammonia-lyase n=1 Tax=Spinactinospora alkalitolerans TaxID=687207 RepID=A0A852U111_9ACTN|nr:threonine/serine dehydratase [Spinactinospora alkalitolerans]NYE47690.1 threonine dehydratase [Spinactinospora alkalitolerans]